MSRPLPLYVQLKELTKASREKLAKEKLTMTAVRDATAKAALQGLNWAAIPLGGSSLASTAHARQLEAQLKGITFEWWLSAARTDDGGYAIDPAELFRVYPPKAAVAPERSMARATGQDATSGETSEAATETAEIAARMAAMEAELKAMKKMLAEVKQSRDDWREQASRMTALLPKPSDVVPARPWWRRLTG